MMNKEIVDFVSKYFLAPQTNEVLEKAKMYWELVKTKKIKLNEVINSNLEFMAGCHWIK